MPPYAVMCYTTGCPHLAAFKVASRWSDGLTDEFKTYYLACPDCLRKFYALAVVKSAACRLALGETLDVPGVYELHRGELDKQHPRRLELES